jgi:hypothetical protein
MAGASCAHPGHHQIDGWAPKRPPISEFGW